MHAIGVDLNPLSQGKKQVDQVKADTEELPFHEQSVDVLYAVRVYFYLHDKLKFLTEVFRVLKKEGVAYVDLGHDMGATQPPLKDIIARAGLSSSFLFQEFEDNKHGKPAFGQIYVLRIQKNEEDKDIIDWQMSFVGATVPKEDEKYTYGTMESYYEPS